MKQDKIEIRNEQPDRLRVNPSNLDGEMACLQISAPAGSDEAARAAIAGQCLGGCIPATLTAPCGCEMRVNIVDDIPLKDARCDCGRNWFVKWVEA